MKTALTCAILALSSLGCSADPAGLKKITEQPARVVWIQDLSANSSDTFASGESLRLMGYCTEDGKGERVIIAGPASLTRPLLSSDGKHVVFTSNKDREFFAVDFSGKNRRKLGNGYALDIRKDPHTGEDWVYYGDEPAKGKGITYRNVRKLNLNDPKEPGPEIWNIAPVSVDNFQLSRDETRACGLFPWPNGGVASLPNKRWEKYQEGCWTSLAPDNSYLLWVFDGAHRNLTLKFNKDDPGWMLNIADAPGINGFEVYHPRWGNHVRFITMTGPYLGDGGKPGGNRIRSGGKSVEIYAGKFNESFRDIEAWCKVTSNERGDFFPDIWVKGGESSNVKDTRRVPDADQPTAKDPTVSTHTGTGLIFIWQNSRSENQIQLENGKAVQCQLSAHGYARYGPHYELVLSSGYARAKNAGERIFEACKASNELSIEAYIAPANTAQTGPARIISFSGNFELVQIEDKLLLRLNTTADGPSRIELCSLEERTGTHLIVTYSKGITTCFVNGRQTQISRNAKGAFSNWSEQELLFGADAEGRHNWDGSLECIAIYDRAIGLDEAKRAYDLLAKSLSKRTPLKRMKAKARLIAMPDVPDPKDIRPYTRCLAQAKFQLTEEARDVLPEAEFVTALWVIMDGKRIPAIPKTGSILELELEPYTANPQLKSERAVLNMDDAILDIYYDPRPIDLIPAR